MVLLFGRYFKPFYGHNLYITFYSKMETLLKLNIFACFLFSVGSEVSGSRGTVIANQNFYFSNDD